MSELPQSLSDWALLSRQPDSLRGLDEDAWGEPVVSSIVDKGIHTPVSRVRDDEWLLWMYFQQSNVPENKKRLSFHAVPVQFRMGVKSAYYRWWMFGMARRTRPNPHTLVTCLQRLVKFLSWLDRHRVQSLAAVRPLHIASYVRHLGTEALSPPTTAYHLNEVQRLFDLGPYCEDRIPMPPWPGSSASIAAGWVTSRDAHESSARTLVIPGPTVSSLFKFCEDVVERHYQSLVEGRNEDWTDNPLVRNAAVFLLGITSGMRSEELIGIEVGCLRLETVDGEQYAWLRSIEHKTKYGPGEWMVPPDAARWVAVLEHWSAPMRSEIQRLLLIEEPRDASTMPPQESAAHLQRLHGLRSAANRIVLGEQSGHLKRPSLLTNGGLNLGFKRLAIEAKVQWPLEAHQMRRTMAVLCAHHKLGDLLYLKKHFKHRSLDMTALYAMNPAQEEALFNELFAALQEVKAEALEHWLDPATPLAGGAATAIRSRQLATLPSRRTMAEDMSTKVSIRATGHGWCLAQDEGCGGQGLYEKTRCVECSSGLIDDRHRAVWLGIREQQEELLLDVDDLGPGAARRIRIDLAKANKVLDQLGILDPSDVPDGH